MRDLTAFTTIVLLCFGALGLFMCGLAAVRQVRLSRHKFNVRLLTELRARRQSVSNNLQ